MRTVQTVRAPRYESQGGTAAEDLALQNIQARLRMVMAYLCAQLLPWVRGRKVSVSVTEREGGRRGGRGRVRLEKFGQEKYS